MFAFELWREFKLSLAEITALFPEWKIVFCNEKILILDDISKDKIFSKANNIGWTIKIIEVKEVFWDLESILEDNLNLEWFEWKFNYAINIFGNQQILPPDKRGVRGGVKELLKISKQVIKSFSLNPRFINQDFKNISSVAIIKEALIKKATDFNFIFNKDQIFFWHTVWVQNIYSYSNRDYGKDRDMNIGMLPPKLAQMMINIWMEKWKIENNSPLPLGEGLGVRAKNYEKLEVKSIYDPFVWLGTVLIEAINMWITKIYWSDINDRMVKTSSENIKKLNDKIEFIDEIFMQNAKYIAEVDFLNQIDLIVTEWYLWEIMTKNNINFERIEKQKIKLNDLYEGFFSWLKKQNFKWTLVISFPFWEIKWKYFYFEEIYDILNKYCKINKLLNDNLAFAETKSWSLLYKRDSQHVGREIFSLKLK